MAFVLEENFVGLFNRGVSCCSASSSGNHRLTFPEVLASGGPGDPSLLLDAFEPSSKADGWRTGDRPRREERLGERLGEVWGESEGRGDVWEEKGGESGTDAGLSTSRNIRMLLWLLLSTGPAKQSKPSGNSRTSENFQRTVAFFVVLQILKKKKKKKF